MRGGGVVARTRRPPRGQRRGRTHALPAEAQRANPSCRPAYGSRVRVCLPWMIRCAPCARRNLPFCGRERVTRRCSGRLLTDSCCRDVSNRWTRKPGRQHTEAFCGFFTQRVLVRAGSFGNQRMRDTTITSLDLRRLFLSTSVCLRVCLTHCLVRGGGMGRHS